MNLELVQLYLNDSKVPKRDYASVLEKLNPSDKSLLCIGPFNIAHNCLPVEEASTNPVSRVMEALERNAPLMHLVARATGWSLSTADSLFDFAVRFYLLPYTIRDTLDYDTVKK